MPSTRRTPALFLALIVSLSACSKPREQVVALEDDVWIRLCPNHNGFGTNQGWIEFEDFALVVDSDVMDTEIQWLQERLETRGKPLRYVVNTHFHADHSHGNARLAALGAEAVATSALRQYLVRMEQDFDKAREFKHYRDIDFVPPTVWFEDRLTLEDGKQRVELLHLGPAHTAADTLVWLPEQGILFTGDVTCNQGLSYLGDADLDGWIVVLEELSRLPVRTVVPSHGPTGGPELLQKQLSFIRDLRDAIDEQIDAGLKADEIAESLTLERHQEWAEQAIWKRLNGVEQHVKMHSLRAKRRLPTPLGLP